MNITVVILFLGIINDFRL